MKSRNHLSERLFEVAKPSVTLSKVSLKKRKSNFDSALLELPQIVDWMSLACSNGVNIYQALWQVGEISNGQLAQRIQYAAKRLEVGLSLEEALNELKASSDSSAIDEFCNRLQLTVYRGTPVAESLRSMSSSFRSDLHNQLLARAGANEIKLLVPLVFFILPVTIWFAVFPSLQLLNLGI